MKTRSVLATALVVLLSLSVVGEVLAATLYSYDLTVPKFGGNVPTYNETKENWGPATVCSKAVGGDYTVNWTLETVSNDNLANNQWNTVGDCSGTSQLANAGAPEQVVHARFGTSWWVPVNVQANGKWSPDQMDCPSCDQR